VVTVCRYLLLLCLIRFLLYFVELLEHTQIRRRDDGRSVESTNGGLSFNIKYNDSFLPRDAKLARSAVFAVVLCPPDKAPLKGAWSGSRDPL